MEYWPCYLSYRQKTKTLSDSELGRLWRALMQYAEEPDIPTQLNGREAMAFEFIAYDIDRARASYVSLCEKQKENGSKGGRPKKTAAENPKNPPVISETQKTQYKDETKTKNKTNNESEIDPPTPLAVDFGTELADAVRSWLTYKHEKRQDYTPTGQQALLTEIRNNADKHGEAAVAALIRHCMASNWQGIIFDRLANKTQSASSPQQSSGASGAAGQHERDAVRRLQQLKQKQQEEQP